MADWVADTGTFPPESLMPSGCTLFGLVMNTERVIHRAGRRRLSEYTVMVTGQVPHEFFRASTYSPDQAGSEFDRYVLSVARADTQ